MAINRSTLRILRQLQVTIGSTADDAVRSLTRAWNVAWDELSTAWRTGMQDAVSQAAATGSWPSTWELARLERFRQAALASEETLIKLGAQAGVIITDGAGQVITATAATEPRLMSSQLPAEAQAAAAIQFGTAIVPAALDVIVSRTQAQIESSLRPLSPAASDAMRRELIRGIAAGDNPLTAAEAMIARVQGAFEGGLVRAANIARTEMLDAYRTTSAYAHGVNSDVLAGWVWHAQLDARTCPSCWSMHGRVFPLDLPGPADHQQGRCARVPKTRSWRDLGFDIDEPADTIVDAEARFRSLSAGAQRAIMGPSRLALLKSGHVSWDDLPILRPSRAWRPSYAPATVRDLERLGRLRAPLTPAERIAQIAAAQRDAVARIATDQASRVQALFADVERRIANLGIPPVRPPGVPPQVPPLPVAGQPTTAAEFEARVRAAASGDDALRASPQLFRYDEATDRWLATDAVPTADRRLVVDSVRRYWDTGQDINEYHRVGEDAYLARRGRKTPVAQVRRTTEGLDKALDLSPLDRDVVVWRGFGGRTVFGPDVDAWAADLRGVQWVDRGYVSTTTMRSEAERFITQGSAGPTDRRGVLARVVLPEGSRALNLGEFEAGEMLVPRGSTFRVVADYGTSGGVRRIDVELVQAAERSTARTVARAVAATPDPALKMTLADIKAAAKAAGVKTYGTRKADILANLRSWEVGNSTRIPGLPEWRAPTITPTAIPPIVAPPLGVPAPGQPVLTGSALNDWADHFKWDLQYGRHEFVDAAGNTVPEGVRVQDLRVQLGASDGSYPNYVVADGTAWQFDGVAYLIEHGPNDYGAPWVSRALAELRAAHDAIAGASQANTSYALLARPNPADVYWKKKFNNPSHSAAASAGEGHITIWKFNPRLGRIETDQIDNLRHETGHNLDSKFGYTSRQPSWQAAADADAITAAKITNLRPTHPEAFKMATVEPGRGFPKGVTQYGRSSADEDFAESVMLYQLGPIATGRVAGEAAERALYFRDIYPARAAFMDRRFPDIARAQQAEVAALRAGATTPTTPPVTPAARARAAQATVDDARTAADGLARALEMLTNDASDRALAHLGRSLLNPAGPLTAGARTAVGPLVKALQAGDKAKIQRAATGLERKLKLARIDAGKTPELIDGRPVLRLDRTRHELVGRDTGQGSKVYLVRPGYTAIIDGQPVVVVRAQVQAIPADVIQKAERAAQRAAARERAAQIETATGTARLLAHVDELIAKQQSLATIRQALDPKLIKPGSLFANANPTTLAALRTAVDTGDIAKVRAAVTRASTSAKIKPISKAGARTKFDAATMEPVGADIKAGTQVTVVTRGSTVTLPDGTVMQLEKARVTPVGPAKATLAMKGDKAPATAIRAMHRMSDPTTGMKTRVSGITHGANDYEDDYEQFRGWSQVDVEIIGKTADEGGYATIIISPDGQTVYYSALALEAEVQGQGFVTRLMTTMFERYQAAGVKTLGIRANADVGGYAWARAGFTFLDAAARQEFAAYARAYARGDAVKWYEPGGSAFGTTRRARLTREIKAAILKVADNPAAEPIDYAMIGHTGGSKLWPGKDFMLGASWRGKMDL